MKLILQPDRRERTEIPLQTEKEHGFLEIPMGKEVVYNDRNYRFYLTGAEVIPAKVTINDDSYDTEFCGKTEGGLEFSLRNCEKPFERCFGAIRIGAEIGGRNYYSASIAVMVSDNAGNQSVLNMIRYIYEHCDDCLYEEGRASGEETAEGEPETVSLDAKITFWKETLMVCRQAYPFLKTNPYSRLQKTERVESFEQLQTVSLNSVRYIVQHADDLVPVNYDTGIRCSGSFYQPNRILSERNSYSCDVYENRVILGFLQMLVTDIGAAVRSLTARTYSGRRAASETGYIDSMYQIFSRSIKRISGYIEVLQTLQSEYRELYYFYSRLLPVTPEPLRGQPVLTPVFRMYPAYRQIYLAIRSWFALGEYDLGRDELLLSFITTTKIYEYYCLIKLLRYIRTQTDFRITGAKRVLYNVSYTKYADTKYNNTFTFENESIRLTLYFQPVIFGDDAEYNGITVFRNTSASFRTESNYRGKSRFYTPDYMLKAEYNGRTEYTIIDAKFTTAGVVRRDHLPEMVYKYLFSLSVLEPQDCIAGLYILCGIKDGADEQDIVHDLAHAIGRQVRPFAEILTMSGNDPEDNSMPAVIMDTILHS